MGVLVSARPDGDVPSRTAPSGGIVPFQVPAKGLVREQARVLMGVGDDGVLWAAGDASVLGGRLVALVCDEADDPAVVARAVTAARMVACGRMVLVTDGEGPSAHAAIHEALRHGGGVVVLPSCGVRCPNEHLGRGMVCVLSQWDDGRPSTDARAARRNVLLAGVPGAMVVTWANDLGTAYPCASNALSVGVPVFLAGESKAFSLLRVRGARGVGGSRELYEALSGVPFGKDGPGYRTPVAGCGPVR